MKIVPTERIDWPPPYKEATEKYASQVRLTTDRRSLVGYVAGQPFPLLVPNDPDVATKIMWNYFFRPVSTDDYDLRFFYCESVYSGLNKPYKVLWYYSVDHYAGYMEVGRTEVGPMPVDPDFLHSGCYAMTGLYPQLAPQDGHGSGFLRYRYADPNRADDAWSYNPQSRRMRRLNDTLMSTDQDSGPESYNPDDFECFAGKNENMTGNISASARCWARLTIRSLLRRPARPMVAAATARRTGRCATCTSYRAPRAPAG